MYRLGSLAIFNLKRPSGGDLLADDPSGVRSHFDELEISNPQLARSTPKKSVFEKPNDFIFICEMIFKVLKVFKTLMFYFVSYSFFC